MILLENKDIKTSEFGICYDIDNNKKYRCYKMVGNYLIIFGFGKMINHKILYSVSELRSITRESEQTTIWEL